MTKIGITGKNGRVGQLLCSELSNGTINGTCLSDAISRDGNAVDLFDRSDCVIDFTTPSATMDYLALAVQHKTPFVIGTTGLNETENTRINEAAQHIPILYAANMSVGVNVLLSLAEKAASLLGDEWDIEILETHHHHKIDSPSGTALALGNAAKAGRSGVGNFVTDRNGKRQSGDIGYAVRRGGDVVGEHVVSFYGAGERIELGHIATNRSLFAQGAIKGAKWLVGQPAGLYSMRDMLGL